MAKMSLYLIEGICIYLKKPSAFAKHTLYTRIDALQADTQAPMQEFPTCRLYLVPYFIHTSTKLLSRGAKIPFRVERGKDFPWFL